MRRVEDCVKEIIIKELGLNISVSDIKDEEFLLDGGLNIDSIMILEIIVELEEMFNITFNDEDINLEVFTSVGEISKFIRSKLLNI